MAQAGVRGAAEAARLAFESVTGLGMSSGSEGEAAAGRGRVPAPLPCFLHPGWRAAEQSLMPTSQALCRPTTLP